MILCVTNSSRALAVVVLLVPVSHSTGITMERPSLSNAVLVGLGHQSNLLKYLPVGSVSVQDLGYHIMGFEGYQRIPLSQLYL